MKTVRTLVLLLTRSFEVQSPLSGSGDPVSPVGGCVIRQGKSWINPPDSCSWRAGNAVVSGAPMMSWWSGTTDTCMDVNTPLRARRGEV